MWNDGKSIIFFSSVKKNSIMCIRHEWLNFSRTGRSLCVGVKTYHGRWEPMYMQHKVECGPFCLWETFREFVTSTFRLIFPGFSFVSWIWIRRLRRKSVSSIFFFLVFNNLWMSKKRITINKHLFFFLFFSIIFSINWKNKKKTNHT